MASESLHITRAAWRGVAGGEGAEGLQGALEFLSTLYQNETKMLYVS
jgi:hypothetical protein